MDCWLSYNQPSFLESLPSTVKKDVNSSPRALRQPPYLGFSSTFNVSGNRCLLRPITFCGRKKRGALIVASTEASRCEFSSLNTPLEPTTLAGKFLSSALQNDRLYFPITATKQLLQLAADRDHAVVRMKLSLGSSEACLHRRIAELKENQCQAAIEDVMYMLICYKFSDIRVHLVPKLSTCMYNGRLEIWPSRDWELESIHSFEVLEMIKEHLTTVVGWKANSNVTDNWATTEIQRLRLCQVYAASILYGYFLKSASLRHRLELGLTTHLQPSGFWSNLKKDAFDSTSSVQSASIEQESCRQGKTPEKLRCYVMGFDPEILQMCGKPRSKEAVNLIEKHCCALYGNGTTSLLESDEVISTSLSSLKRLVLEAVAFGSFLWEAEKYVGSVYKLTEN